MVTLSIVLNKRRKRSDNTYPINFRFYFQGKVSTRSTKINVEEKHWDDNKKLIKSNLYNSTVLNARLLKDFADLQLELLLDDEKIKQYLCPKLVDPVVPQKPKLTIYASHTNVSN